MNVRIAKTASLAALGLLLASFAGAQTYRQSYPLGDTSSLDGLCLNLNISDPSDAQLQQIQDAGFKYVRYELTWAGIEAQPGDYNWAVTDRFMARAKAHGLRVMMLLAFSNPVYTSTGAPNTDAARAGFAAYAAAAAARYTHQGVIWEIYNEPNLANWWTNPNPVDYALLANQTAQAIRAVSSDEWIVGLTTEILRADNTTYINTALDNGILANLDGVGFHPYTNVGPESMMPQWTSARTLVEAKRPANHPVTLLAGETGYARAWTGITTTNQSTYTVRTALVDLVQGLPLTNVYSYDDVYGGDDWHSTSGLTTYETNIPYPVYYGIQRMTTALKGYKYSKRLTLASNSDYALLFTNPNVDNDVKLVVWTSGSSHTVTVPSSAANFASTAFTSGATGSAAATAAGLTVTATDDATVYASTANNPLLNIAGDWATLPGSVTLTTHDDAIGQLSSLIVSPAWSEAPTGSTLKIEDAAAAVTGYSRPSYTTTLSNLSTLTVKSPAVQTVFNSLGGLQDETNAARTLTFTVQLPDGSSIKQVASVLRKQPMSVFPTMPQSGALTLRVENPSGAWFQGTIKARSGALEVSQPVQFYTGDTYKMFFFPTLLNAMIATDVSFDLYDSSGNVLSTATPVVTGVPQIVSRAQYFALGGYSIQVTGTANVTGTASLTYGVGAWEFLTGTTTLDIKYAFGAGSWKAVSVIAPSSLAATSFAKTPIAVGMWVLGDGSKNFMRAQFADASGQTFQVTGGAMDWTGWRWVTIPVAGNLTQHWGGSNDGVVHGAMRCTLPFLLDSNQVGTAGTVSLAGITVISQK